MVKTTATSRHDTQRQARAVAETVTDPELPMLTLADLGVLRDVDVDDQDRVLVVVTPTYSGCPAITEMRSELRHRLLEAGHRDVEIQTALNPPWTSDWITAEGRRKLAEHGIEPPGSAPQQPTGPTPLTLEPTRRVIRCTRCGSTETEELSPFSATACRALWRCRRCSEPFERFKEV